MRGRFSSGAVCSGEKPATEKKKKETEREREGEEAAGQGGGAGRQNTSEDFGDGIRRKGHRQS